MSEAVLYRVELPMHIGFDHPAARRRCSDSLVLTLDVDGASGTGECAPRSYVTGETTDSVTAALRQVPMDKLFAQIRSCSPGQLLEQLRSDGFETTFAVHGGNNLVCLLETAVLDLLGNRLRLGARQLVPGQDGSGDTPAALPVSQVLDLSISVEEFLASRGPFHFVKIKASEDIERDVRTVTAIREHTGAGVPVLVDANMSWSQANAVTNARRLRECGVDYVEEPLPKRSWRHLRELRRDSGIRVMLDESLCTMQDARIAVEAEACDVFNVRVAKNGGLLNSARLVDVAKEAGLEFQIGVQVAEVGPLINASRALAFRRPGAITVEAGQSDRFFPEMIVSPRPLIDRAANTVAPVDAPGFGMALTDAARPWATARFTQEGGRWQPVPTP